MDKKYLQNSILESAYNRNVWLDVLKEFFGVRKILVQPPQISVDKSKAEYAVELGSFRTADDREVGIYEVKLLPRIWIERNRVGLRSLLRQVYKYDVDAALIVFVQDEKWRFSYVSEIRTEDGKKETEPKRYTYLFGKDESCRTAADRFDKLKGKPILLDDLYEAFSVEKLNKEFFKSYKEYYEKFWKYLAADKKYYKILADARQEDVEKKQKPIRDFSKKLLGRIVFLQFLQKKGWLGVPVNNKEWKDGDVKFLQSLFVNNKNKNKFYSTVLKTLFFETLNTKRKNDEAPASLGKGIKIPYLNGGLFDKDISFEYDFDFPVEYFENLLGFFEQYNFTIDENDPYDNEVGIDPEMLGHIFENLLEENREKGAFYTPKEIVHYMCQESLIEYLKTNYKLQITNYELRDKAIEKLVRLNKVDDVFTDYKEANKLDELLKAVKICDPAIGSGAFPMGLLKEIFECRRLLYGYLKTNESFDPALVKKEIIRQNIYGVDLENGAVEIARLRFWLALVVDETEPQPLPNLDYKIMQGNSLLESYEGIDLSNLADLEKEETFISAEYGQYEIGRDFSNKKQTILLFDEKSKTQLYELINDYFNYDETSDTKYLHKQFIKDEINRIVEGKLIAKFYLEKPKIEKMISDIKYALSANRIFSDNTPAKRKKIEKNKEKLKVDLLKNEKEFDKINNIVRQLHELQNLNDKPYFLWHLYFKDVFDQGGFDIVIGNPPYRQLQKMGVECDILEKANFETFTRTGDIYCLFYEMGNKLLKENAVLTYITSNTWMRTKFGELLRDYFAEKTNPMKLINFEDTKIFQTATVETNIILIKHAKFKNKLKAVAVNPDYTIGTSINEYFNKNFIELNELPRDGWIILSKQDYTIKNMIAQKGKQLKEWNIEFYRGFLTGFNDAFFIDAAKRKELIKEDSRNENFIKPLLRGRNIKKYSYDFDELYVLFIPWHFPLVENQISGASIDAENALKKQYPSIYKHLLQYKRELLNRNKSETGIRYEWYCLQRAAATYVNEFEKEKLVWLSISDKPAFALDTEKRYVTAPAYILTSEKNNIRYLLSLLNSKAMEWYLDKVSSSTGQGTNQWSKIFVEQLPIPEVSDEILQNKFEVIADYLIYLHDKSKPTVNLSTNNEIIASFFEDVLNMMVYELYFKEHMVEQELDVLKFVEFENIDKTKSDKAKAEIINEVYKKLQDQKNQIRNRIILSNIRSKNIIGRINATTH